jgi:hypothetical protein
MGSVQRGAASPLVPCSWLPETHRATWNWLRKETTDEVAASHDCRLLMERIAVPGPLGRPVQVIQYPRLITI